MSISLDGFQSARDPIGNDEGRIKRRRFLSALILGLLLSAPLAHAVQSADLSLTNTVSNPTPAIGARVTFTVTVTNSGPATVQHLGVRDKLPAGYTFVSYTATRGTYNASNGQWINFGLPKNVNGQLVITATVKQSGNRVYVAEVISSANPDPDSTPNNGNPAEDDYAQVTTTPHRNVAPRIISQQPLPLSTLEDTLLTVQFSNLIVNDPDNPYPTGFTLTLQPGVNYTVTPPNQLLPVANFNGTLTVPVIVNDGISNSLPFNLTVSVTPVNDAPVIIAQQPLPLSTLEDTTLTVVPANLTVSDPDGPNPFTLTLQPGANYTVTPPNQLLPVANFNGTLTVPVIVNDGASNSLPFNLTVSVTPVNDAPVIIAQQPLPLSTLEDTTLTVVPANLTVSDPDGPNPFTLTLQPGANYTVTPPNQLLPVANFNGTLTVPVIVSDGLSNSAPFAMLATVTPVNDPPVITAQVTLSVAPETPLTITLAAITVVDPDSSDFSLTVAEGTGYRITGPNEITPEAGVTGPVTVPVTVNDGAVDSEPFPLLVTVTATPNVPPVIVGPASVLSTPEETPLTITLADIAVDDPDNVYPADFTLTVLAGAHYTRSGDEVTPEQDFNGDLSVPVTVSDGLSSSDPFVLDVTITPVDDPPVILGQVPLSTGEHTALVISLDELHIVDPDSSDFTLTLLPGTGYELAGDEVTPDAGFVGELTVPATVSDGSESSDVFDLDVTVTAPPPLNIIMIMLDDLDNRSLQDLLNAGLLPNVQTSIVDRGVDFTQAHVTTPLCCPSRSSYYTGQYPHNHGIVNNLLAYPGAGLQRAAGLFDDSVTVATRLRALGYTTAHIGKYLNGYGSDASLASLAPAFEPHYIPPGWLTWYGLVDFSTYCVYNYKINQDGVLTTYSLPLGQSEDTATYQTNILAGLAESFLLEHRDDAAPFYLEVTPIVPHAEICAAAYDGQPPPNGEEGFGGRIRPAPEYESAVVPDFVPSPSYDEDVSDKPNSLGSQWPALTSDDLANVTVQYQQRLRAMLSVDDLVRRIVTALGPAVDNTLLVFTSDNGWMYGEHRVSGKIFAYEESAAVPLYIVMPGANSAGSSSALVLNNDLAPTMLDLASPGYADSRFDGRSLAPLLQGGGAGTWNRRQFVIEFQRTFNSANAAQHPTYIALRKATTLYIETYGGTYYAPPPVPLIGLEEYDLATDQYEMNSLMHYPEDARDPVLGPLIDHIHGCQGSTCTQYEDAATP